MEFKPGDVIKINMGLYWHYGITDNNGNIIHNSKKRGMVTCESLQEFSEGKPVIKDPKLTGDNQNEAIKKASSYIGLPYNLFFENCEQFVRMVYGRTKESPQIQKYLLGATGVILLRNSDNTPIKYAAGAATITAFASNPNESPIPKALIAAAIGFLVGTALDNKITTGGHV